MSKYVNIFECKSYSQLNWVRIDFSAERWDNKDFAHGSLRNFRVCETFIEDNTKELWTMRWHPTKHGICFFMFESKHDAMIFKMKFG